LARRARGVPQREESPSMRSKVGLIPYVVLLLPFDLAVVIAILVTQLYVFVSLRFKKHRERPDSPLPEEGCPSHQITLEGEGGVVAHTETLLVSDHPARSYKVASQHLFDVASTLPHEEGNIPQAPVATIVIANW